MLVYHLCMSVLLTCELHLIGFSAWSATSPVLTYEDVYSPHSHKTHKIQYKK